MSQQLWHVAHTRPRCEKKLLQYCGRENLEASLPCYKAVHKYRGKTVVFKKPLFPGYVFLQISAEKHGTVIQSDYLANLLEVTDVRVCDFQPSKAAAERSQSARRFQSDFRLLWLDLVKPMRHAGCRCVLKIHDAICATEV
jgi:hypothetical protein